MSAPVRRAGVVGWPVAHSLSPALHGAWIEAAGIDATYEAIPLNPDDAESELRRLGDRGLVGVNVTVPHKHVGLAVADDVSDAARAVGAANLLVVREGRLFADNTDAAGFVIGLRASRLAPWMLDLALVLGAGGAARAAAYALKEGGCGQVIVINRTKEKADRLAAEIGGPALAMEWERRGEVAGDAGLIVNATSLGMTGQPALDLDLSQANENAVVYDLVYSPLETPLLASARARGLRTVDGLGMLIGQARPSFQALFGVAPPSQIDARRVLLDALEARS